MNREVVIASGNDATQTKPHVEAGAIVFTDRPRRRLFRRLHRERGEGWPLALQFRIKHVTQRRIQYVDRPADLPERDRSRKAVLHGVDLGLVARDGDQVEKAFGLAFHHQQLVGAERAQPVGMEERARGLQLCDRAGAAVRVDRKSTRLNSSHRTISYAVFCLTKKNSSTVVLPLRPNTSSTATPPRHSRPL